MMHAPDAFKIELVGSTIADRYSIEREISSSPLCVVFRAEDQKRQRPVALRVYAPLVSLDRPETQAWSEDVEQVGQWAHHHFLPTQDLGRIEGGDADGLLFSAEPFIKSGSLEERLKLGELPLDEALRYALQLLNSLEALHNAGRYHLNLRPSNLFVSENDFGVHQLIVSGVGSHHFFNFQGATSGDTLASPFYLIPELIQGQAPTPRSDIYAFGVLIYELVTGRTPFPHKDAKRAARSHLNDRPVKSRLANPRAKISKAIDEFITKCLEKDPANRPQSATEARLQLEALVGEGSHLIKNNLASLFTPSPVDLVKSAEASESAPPPEEGPQAPSAEASEPIPSELEPEQAPLMNQTMVGYTTPEELKELLKREDELREAQERAEEERAQEKAKEEERAQEKAKEEALAQEKAKEEERAQKKAKEKALAQEKAKEEALAEEKAKEEATKKAEAEALEALETAEREAAVKIAERQHRSEDKPKTQLHRAEAPADDQLGWFVDNPEDLEYEEEPKPFNIFGKLLAVMALVISAGVYYITQPPEGTTPDIEKREATPVSGAPKEVDPNTSASATNKGKSADQGLAGAQVTSNKEDVEANSDGDDKLALQKSEERSASTKVEEEATAKKKAEEEAKKKAAEEAKKKAEEEAKKKRAQSKRSKRSQDKKKLQEYKKQLKVAKRAQSKRNWKLLEKEAQAAIKLKANGWEGHALLGEAYFKRNLLRSAVQSFKRSTRYSRRASVYLDLGQAYYKLKDYRSAQKAWEKAQAVGRGDTKSRAERYLKMVEKKIK